jgi:hypothetical protein
MTLYQPSGLEGLIHLSKNKYDGVIKFHLVDSLGQDVEINSDLEIVLRVETRSQDTMQERIYSVLNKISTTVDYIFAGLKI